MNERIKDLMAQAGFDPAAIERMGVMPNAEKFAELIVKECVAFMNDNDSARWEIGFRNIVTILLGPRDDFEIADVVEMVRRLKQTAEQELVAPQQQQLKRTTHPLDVPLEVFFGLFLRNGND